MMEQCKEKLSIAMFTGQNQLRSDGLWCLIVIQDSIPAILDKCKS